MAILISANGRVFDVPDTVLAELSQYEVSMAEEAGEQPDVEGQWMTPAGDLDTVLKGHAGQVLRMTGYRLREAASLLRCSETELLELLESS
ncbi:MAG: hypothetical protein KJ052_07215 [Candidatus Hydrogenedentes bacterium]|nr:hypothetical protein [Candidatus Hydrogenedentota bacterium]